MRFLLLNRKKLPFGLMRLIISCLHSAGDLRYNLSPRAPVSIHFADCSVVLVNGTACMGGGVYARKGRNDVSSRQTYTRMRHDDARN
jgi:hypothetical protein